MSKFKKKTYSNIFGVSIALGSLGLIASDLTKYESKNMVIGQDNDKNLVIGNELNSVTRASNQFDYTPIADNKYSAPISTESGYIGYSDDQRQLIMTAYEGVEIWRLDLNTNSDFKSFYSTQYPNANSSSVKIISWKYLQEKDIIVILVSDTNNNEYKNGLVFAVEAYLLSKLRQDWFLLQ